jgi:hypothetical protein
MIKTSIVVTIIALSIGLSNVVFAQQSTGNTTTNAARSGGPGTHVGAERTGSVSSNDKVLTMVKDQIE